MGIKIVLIYRRLENKLQITKLSSFHTGTWRPPGERSTLEISGPV